MHDVITLSDVTSYDNKNLLNDLKKELGREKLPQVWRDTAKQFQVQTERKLK